ncbi:hypothetical protein FD46_GL000389 [Liquorilactobacillus oeni DSM 19972]|uniref:Uncharacterized protein n=2 Tax=Liquorilactobacillus oeni TaxID=303241 RepID=A0A0R1MC39_9LACO|nr:hypothetical protein FD46_GL000389 [Liquorilactobacillus oeni DSM 19972]
MNDALSVAVLFIFAIGIGFYQSVSFKVKVVKIKSKYFFLDKDSQETNIYQKTLYAKGGKKYLIGWILIFLISLFLNGDFNDSFTFYKFSHELVKEIIADLSIFMKLKATGNDWKSWELLGFANIAYLIFIRQKSAKMNEFFKKRTIE